MRGEKERFEARFAAPGFAAPGFVVGVETKVVARAAGHDDIEVANVKGT